MCGCPQGTIRMPNGRMNYANLQPRTIERDPSAQEEVEFWEAQVIRLIEKQDNA
jgi:hypothetical protein